MNGTLLRTEVELVPRIKAVIKTVELKRKLWVDLRKFRQHYGNGPFIPGEGFFVEADLLIKLIIPRVLYMLGVKSLEDFSKLKASVDALDNLPHPDLTPK